MKTAQEAIDNVSWRISEIARITNETEAELWDDSHLLVTLFFREIFGESNRIRLLNAIEKQISSVAGKRAINALLVSESSEERRHPLNV